jgi:hypothetical protein
MRRSLTDDVDLPVEKRRRVPVVATGDDDRGPREDHQLMISPARGLTYTTASRWSFRLRRGGSLSAAYGRGVARRDARVRLGGRVSPPASEGWFDLSKLGAGRSGRPARGTRRLGRGGPGPATVAEAAQPTTPRRGRTRPAQPRRRGPAYRRIRTVHPSKRQRAVDGTAMASTRIPTVEAFRESDVT